MYARAVESAGVRLRELRLEEWEDFGLALLAFALSLVATQRAPTFVFPLFLGGVAALALGTRALWRRWDLVDQLCDDRDAYVIPEVLERAARETTMRRRRSFAIVLRYWLGEPGTACGARAAGVADDVRSLACELEDEALELEPEAGVTCMRLVSDPVSSPLLNPDVPEDELRSRILQIRAGLQPRRARLQPMGRGFSVLMNDPQPAAPFTPSGLDALPPKEWRARPRRSAWPRRGCRGSTCSRSRCWPARSSRSARSSRPRSRPAARTALTACRGCSAALAFSLGLILVVVAGAELFTGNNLIVMAWASRRVSTARLLGNWAIVCVGNFVGAIATAVIVYVSGQYEFGDGAVGQTALSIAAAKTSLGFVQAVALGMLCNALVCLAMWLTYGAHTTTDKILAIIPPIAAFVAAGFEHSVANMYFISIGLLDQERRGVRREPRSRFQISRTSPGAASSPTTSCR